MRRFCMSLNLRPDPLLMAEYVARHRAVWPEVLQSIRNAGVLDMQIYQRGTQLFMIMDTTEDFTFERKRAMDQANPIVMRWENEMSKYQAVESSGDASQKWIPMESIFHL